MKSVFLIFLLVLLSASVFSQQKQDVIYTKKGWIIRGEITSETLADSIKIQTRDGNLFVFYKDEVSKITREDAKKIKPDPAPYRTKGFFSATDIGFMTNNSENTGTALTLQTVNGWRFGRLLYLGLGLGFDLYEPDKILPVFASWRGDFNKKGRVHLFGYADYGYGENVTRNNDPNIISRGGRFVAAGGGIKFGTYTGNAFYFRVGHQSQKANTITSFGTSRNEKRQTFNRFAFRFGFTF
ncbi:MAG: hypothetical protein H7Y04_05480 [Verrucomicrobia bacterium]|nr:hypothetical protein [Cytophagales bacterium]